MEKLALAGKVSDLDTDDEFKRKKSRHSRHLVRADTSSDEEDGSRKSFMPYDFPDTNLLSDTPKKKKSNVVDDVFATLELPVVQTVSVIQDSNQNILEFEPTTEQTISVHPKNIEKNADKTSVAASKMYLFLNMNLYR